MTTFTIITAEIKAVTRYHCVKCETVENGSTQKFSITANSPQEVADFLDKQPQRAGSMPIGWGNFADGFRCQKCSGAEYT